MMRLRDRMIIVEYSVIKTWLEENEKSSDQLNKHPGGEPLLPSDINVGSEVEIQWGSSTIINESGRNQVGHICPQVI